MYLKLLVKLLERHLEYIGSYLLNVEVINRFSTDSKIERSLKLSIYLLLFFIQKLKYYLFLLKIGRAKVFMANKNMINFYNKFYFWSSKNELSMI
jgi:hypothetical protein